MPPTGCVLHVEHRRRPPVQETEEQNVQDVFGGLGQYRPNDAQTAPLAQPSHSHQAHQSGGRGLHLPTALPCFLGGYNEGKVRKTGSELPRVDFPYLIERSGGRGILPLVSRVPEPVLPKLTDSLISGCVQVYLLRSQLTLDHGLHTFPLETRALYEADMD